MAEETMTMLYDLEEYTNIINDTIVPGNLSDQEKEERYLPLYNFLQSHIPSRLYRFRSCKERSFHEFDQDILGFSPAYEMNDDFDGLLYFNKEQIANSINSSLTTKNINDYVDLGFDKAIPKECNELISESSYKQMADGFRNLSLNEQEELISNFKGFVMENYDDRSENLMKLTQNLKIASLSSCIKSAAMWGYYANNGTGFALAYDLRNISFSCFCIYPVIYGEKRIDATSFAIWLIQQQLLVKLFRDLYCGNTSISRMIPCPDEFMSSKILIHKASDWKHEKEWRLIINEKYGQNEKYPHVICKPCEIYLGRNISAINEKILRSIASEKNIPVRKMGICTDDPTYSLMPK